MLFFSFLSPTPHLFVCFLKFGPLFVLWYYTWAHFSQAQDGNTQFTVRNRRAPCTDAEFPSLLARCSGNDLEFSVGSCSQGWRPLPLHWGVSQVLLPASRGERWEGFSTVLQRGLLSCSHETCHIGTWGLCDLQLVIGVRLVVYFFLFSLLNI